MKLKGRAIEKKGRKQQIEKNGQSNHFFRSLTFFWSNEKDLRHFNLRHVMTIIYRNETQTVFINIATEANLEMTEGWALQSLKARNHAACI